MLRYSWLRWVGLLAGLVLASIAGAVGAESPGHLPVAATTGSITPQPAPAKAKPPAAKGASVETRPVDAVERAAAEAEELVGDASLRGLLDLAAAKLEDERLVAPLGDRGKAILTIDPELQKRTEEVLAQAKAPLAAAVVMTVDGRILAIAGRRNQAPEKPRDFDLPVTVWAPAASVFKIVTGTALIDAGVSPGQRVCYHGGVRSIESSNLRDDPKRDGRCNDLAFGLARSQNAIIAKLTHEHLTPDRLREFARRFGFDTAPDFVLTAEPNRFAIPDQALSFARVSAGFWHTELSPLGGALVANLIAAGGKQVTPRLVDAVVDKQGKRLPVVSAPSRRVVDAAVAAKMAKALTGTTEAGTAYKGFHDRRGRKHLPKVEVAGKTGTLTRGKPSYLQYSWFVGFAPADRPAVTISVLLGNPERWHLKAHTAARLILEKALDPS